MYPLVCELAADGIPVVVTCRVLKIARQPCYRRWLTNPVTAAELAEAYLANALFDAHLEDLEFGYRFLADEARDAGHTACDRTMSRVCSVNGWWSVFGKKRGKKGKSPARRSTMTSSSVTSPPTRRTGCGLRTSPSTRPVTASPCARSRTSARTGSWATRLAIG